MNALPSLFGTTAVRRPPWPKTDPRRIPDEDAVNVSFPKEKRRRRMAPPRPCEACGKPFRPETHRLTVPTRGKLCSTTCRDMVRVARAQAIFRVRLLEALEKEGGQTAPALGKAIGLSAERTRRHLVAMQGTGQVYAKRRVGSQGGIYRGAGWWLL